MTRPPVPPRDNDPLPAEPSHQIHEVATAAARTAGDLAEAVTSLDRAVVTCLDGDWPGDSAVVFTTAWAIWRHGADEVIDALTMLAETLGKKLDADDASETGGARRTAPGLAAIATRIRQVNTATEEKLEDLDRQLRAGVSSTRGGFSSPSHQAAHQKWTDAIQQMRDGLDMLRELTEEASGTTGSTFDEHHGERDT